MPLVRPCACAAVPRQLRLQRPRLRQELGVLRRRREGSVAQGVCKRGRWESSEGLHASGAAARLPQHKLQLSLRSEMPVGPLLYRLACPAPHFRLAAQRLELGLQ